MVNNDAVILCATTLPNPYKAIRSCQLQESRVDIETWIRNYSSTSAKKLDCLIKRGCDAVTNNVDVRVECRGGRHRSQVVAFAIAKATGVQMHAMDAAPLPP